MTAGPGKHVVIVGCGIVGVSVAVWLQRAGHRVTLVDRAGPAGGTAYGNAGVLASSAVVPVTVPGIIRKAPGMLADRSSPLFMIWSYFPALLPWLVRYLGYANHADVLRIARALYPLLHDSLEQHQDLAAGTGAEQYVHPGFYYFAYGNRAEFVEEKAAWDVRRDLGYRWEEMDGAAFGDAEPVFENRFGFAVRLGGHGRISDPGEYVSALADHVVSQQGRLVIAEVRDIRLERDAVQGLVTREGEIACDAMVLATGAWSGPLVGKFGFGIPLETERGYHIELVNPSRMPAHPVMVASRKFVATPMDGRLRCAGLLEFGGLTAKSNRRALGLLEEQVGKLMPGLRYDRIEHWLGHRPAPADSIPYIGAVPGVAGAYMALGHHHVGLTAGAKTGRVLAQLISSGAADIDLDPYRVSRSN